jgi:hypothetical protein
MKRLSILLFIAILTFIAVLYVKRPDLLSHVWLWVVGLAAPIIGLFKRLAEYLVIWFHEKIQKKTNKPVNTQPVHRKP